MSCASGNRPSDQVDGDDQRPSWAETSVGLAAKLGMVSYGVPQLAEVAAPCVVGCVVPEFRLVSPSSSVPVVPALQVWFATTMRLWFEYELVSWKSPSMRRLGPFAMLPPSFDVPDNEDPLGSPGCDFTMATERAIRPSGRINAESTSGLIRPLRTVQYVCSLILRLSCLKSV